ncbi:MAG: prepilin-type N-terminal cleavage/methylation domain-containing protein [Homoserinimonas sp.]
MIKAINRSIAARHEDDEKGFTLIELLVVILIIGVLAAIAIPAFLNQRESAWASQVETDLKNAAIAAEAHAVENNGEYSTLEAVVSTDAGVVSTNWDAAGFNATQDVAVSFAAHATIANAYVLTGTHKSRAGDSWSYDSSTGVITSP